MFKLLKSKKGFTLVELMIVVVIMAILVAVAVPIYSAVTKNARIKTCAGNRREIVSQVNNYTMGSIDGVQHITDMDFVIESNGDKGSIKSHNNISETVISKLFHELPYCPSGEEDALVEYSVVITAHEETDSTSSYATVVVTCNAAEGHT